MIKSFKAIMAGSLFIVIVILFLQLIYIFLAVGYNQAAKEVTVLNDISGIFRYIIGIPIITATMFFGGYITASIAKVKVIAHCVVVAMLTVGGMILPTLENSDITITGIVVIVLALIGTTSGGLYWKSYPKYGQDL